MISKDTSAIFQSDFKETWAVWLHIPINGIILTAIKCTYKSSSITNSLQAVLIFFINFLLLFSTYTACTNTAITGWVEREGALCSTFCTSDAIALPECLGKHNIRSASYNTSIINRQKQAG